MKMIFVLGALLASALNVQAAELVAFHNYVSVPARQNVSEADRAKYEAEDYVGIVAEAVAAYTPSFEYNAKLGRAWVTLRKNVDKESYKKMELAGSWLVPGLAYDAASASITLNGAVVATVREHTGLFGWGTTIDYVSPLKLSIEKKAVDTGFDIEQQDFVVISL